VAIAELQNPRPPKLTSLLVTPAIAMGAFVSEEAVVTCRSDARPLRHDDDALRRTADGTATNHSSFAGSCTIGIVGMYNQPPAQVAHLCSRIVPRPHVVCRVIKLRRRSLKRRGCSARREAKQCRGNYRCCYLLHGDARSLLRNSRLRFDGNHNDRE
jgi:hypothetical protein